MAELSSNGVPFEVIEDESPAAFRIGVELEVYDHANPSQLIDIVPRRVETQMLSEMRANGGGSFKIHEDDVKLIENPNLLAGRNIVKCRLDGQIVGGFILRDMERVYVDKDEDSGRIFSVAGEGLRSWLADATVHPYGGIKPDSQNERVFSFASEQGSWYKPADWVTPINVAQYDMDPAGNTSPWGTAPAEWPDVPNAYWIWGVDNPKGSTAPEGFNYFRYEFTIDPLVGTKSYSVFAAADDVFEVYMDASQVILADEENAYARTWRADFTLAPGAHILAIRVRNKGGNAGLISALFRAGDVATETAAELLTATGGAGWKVNAYPDPAPGWTPGEIMLTLLAEAEARGIRMAETLVPTFTEEEDSEGVTWPRSLDWKFDIGSEYTTVVEKLEELVCDVWVDPANYQLHMAVTRGSRRDEQTESVQPVKFEIGRNVQQAGEESSAQIKNTLLVRTEDGWELQTDADTNSITTYGVVEGLITTDASSAVSADVATAAFTQFAEPQTSATFQVIDLDDARPFVDFNVGDWVLAPGATGLEPRRVMSLSFRESRTGLVEFAIEFDTIFQDKGMRLERWLKTIGDGTLGGSVSNSSGGGSGTGIPGSQSARRGPQGPPGGPGPEGDSAYDVAVANGFVGTEAAWLESLMGADGAPGADGDSAYEVAVANGFVGTEAEWLASLVGEDGTASLPARAVATYTTGSLANNAEETGVISMATAYRLLRISLDEPARVRIYATAAQRTADAARPVGTDPTGDHGLMMEFVGTESLLAMTLSPSVDGASMETVPSTDIPIAVTNLSGATDTVQVSLTYLRTE